MGDEVRDVGAVLTTTSERWHRLSRAFSVELFARRPTKTEWSALECLQHLVNSEGVYLFRVSGFMKSLDFPSSDPDRNGTQVSDRSPSDLGTEFEVLSLQSLDAVDGRAGNDLVNRVCHQVLGLVTLGEMLSVWVAQDLHHSIQAERALIQPYLQGCGPWIRYYENHLIQESSNLQIS